MAGKPRPLTFLETVHNRAEHEATLPLDQQSTLSNRKIRPVYADVLSRWAELENMAKGLTQKTGFNRHDAINLALQFGIDKMALRVEALEKAEKAKDLADAATAGTELVTE